MSDIFDKCATDQGYFGRFRAAKDRFFTLPVIDDLPGPHMNFQGQDNIMWSVNNYIGLAHDADIKAAAMEATEKWSVCSPMGSRMMSGSTSEHLALEKSLADYAQKEDSFLFNFGYMGVVGTVTALTGPDDTLIVDKLAHACIVDAAFSAKGGNGGKTTVRFFRHNDMADLESVLKSVNKDRKGGVMILTEGVYGMTGDLANLKGITALARQYDARVFIDDAHGIGVIGDKGRGTADHQGVQKEIDIYFGTFAKSFASIGGYSATSTQVRDWIAYNARTQVFAKALPMPYVKSLQVALQKVMDGDHLRARMWERSNQLKDGLRDLGYHIGTGDSPICAVFTPVGDNLEDVAMGMLSYLRKNNIFCTGVVWPVIPPGLVMFRMIPTAAHSEEDVARTVEVFKNMRDDLKIQFPLGDSELGKINRIYRD
ncbi:MAG: pyridoxal phosphate-dependent aminotransferase family protein [Spirochaetales bacterium]|nr:pyridoxal phosphate-dependent aminotransferase family protein [Spirochaetales bacterium]